MGVIAIGILVIVMACVGHRTMKKSERIVTEVTQQVISQNADTEILGRTTYHGGLPQMPKIAVLKLGVTHDYLVVFDDQGLWYRIYFRDWIKFEQFRTKRKVDQAGESFVLPGLHPILVKEKIRYFVTIKYRDTNREENNILLEANDKILQQKIYNKLEQSWHNRNISVDIDHQHCVAY